MDPVWVALIVPAPQESSPIEVIGVYTSLDRAQAACFRASETLGYHVATRITEVRPNIDEHLDG